MSGLTPIAVTDRDDSMRLLYLVLDDANHTFGPPTPKNQESRFRGVFMGFTFLVLIGILFGTALSLTRFLDPTSDTTKVALRDRISIANQKLLEAQIKVEDLNTGNGLLSNDLSNLSQRAQNLASRVSSLEELAGFQPIRGNGIQVIIEPAVTPKFTEGVDLGIVLDSDVTLIVNGMFVGGAQAVAVNDYRLTSLSAIRSAGEAILVDYQALIPPYRIVAIGDVTKLERELKSGITSEEIAEISKGYGVRFKVESVSQISLPGSNIPLPKRASVRND